MQANRNGFFYVSIGPPDRCCVTTAVRAQAQTWSSGIGADGRPVVLHGSDPTAQGTRVCPSVEGRHELDVHGVQSRHAPLLCDGLGGLQHLHQVLGVVAAGKSFYGGAREPCPRRGAPEGAAGDRPADGEVAWEVPQIGEATSWGGVLSTAGGLVFYGDDSGALAAVNATTGAPLWHFHTNAVWKASPMTYAADGKQYVAVEAGSQIIAFALPSP